jgi:hypothetical protein
MFRHELPWSDETGTVPCTVKEQYLLPPSDLGVWTWEDDEWGLDTDWWGLENGRSDLNGGGRSENEGKEEEKRKERQREMEDNILDEKTGAWVYYDSDWKMSSRVSWLGALTRRRCWVRKMKFKPNLVLSFFNKVERY